MTTYTDVQLKEQPSEVLDKASAEGEVRIRRIDGSEFQLRPLPIKKSPLDVGYVKLKNPLSADEIVALIREGRERDYGVK